MGKCIRRVSAHSIASCVDGYTKRIFHSSIYSRIFVSVFHGRYFKKNVTGKDCLTGGREETRDHFPNRNVFKIGSYFAKFPGGTQAGGRSYPRTPSLSGPRRQSCGPRHAEGPLTPAAEVAPAVHDGDLSAGVAVVPSDSSLLSNTDLWEAS